MVFKNFRVNIIFRVIALNANILAVIWLILNTNYHITTITLGIVAILQITLLISYAERTNHMFVKFLNAIRYDDFSQTYTTKGLGRSFDNLNREFNKVILKFQEIRAEKEANYHYLRTIVQHIAIGLLVFDEKGQVQLINQTAKQLLDVNRLNHINQFREEHQELVQYFSQTESEKRELIKFRNDDRILHLAVRKTSVKLRGEVFHIVSIQDIQSELEDKEMEAWQNLIRVLTHEIINSVTPIASLSSTVNEDLTYHLEQVHKSEKEIEGKKHLLLPAHTFQESVEEVHYAIKTIQKRSEGLIRFVRDFRSLTKVPMPQLHTLTLKHLVEDIVFLQREEFKKNQVHFHLDIQPEDLTLIADVQLLEQVLINLLKNAVQALDQEPEKHIHFRAFKDRAGKTILQIQDNGCGISEEAMKNIFVPFFTTKKSGSGIGLSFSRQVMRLHGGTINLESKLGEGTVFTLRFP